MPDVLTPEQSPEFRRDGVRQHQHAAHRLLTCPHACQVEAVPGGGLQRAAEGVKDTGVRRVEDEDDGCEAQPGEVRLVEQGEFGFQRDERRQRVVVSPGRPVFGLQRLDPVEHPRESQREAAEPLRRDGQVDRP